MCGSEFSPPGASVSQQRPALAGQAPGLLPWPRAPSRLRSRVRVQRCVLAPVCHYPREWQPPPAVGPSSPSWSQSSMCQPCPRAPRQRLRRRSRAARKRNGRMNRNDSQYVDSPALDRVEGMSTPIPCFQPASRSGWRDRIEGRNARNVGKRLPRCTTRAAGFAAELGVDG